MARKIIAIVVALICVIAFVVVIVLAAPVMRNRRYLKKYEAYYNSKVSSFINENRTIDKGAIVFLGDSITDGCDLKRFYPELNAVNRGISGDHTLGVLDRMDSSVYDLEPELVVLLIGVNDLTLGVDATDVLTNIRTIIDEIRINCPMTKIIVQSIYPTNPNRWDKKTSEHHQPLIIEINAALEADATNYGYTYANVYPLLTDENGHFNEAYADDGLHPNSAGYEVISAYLKPIIDNVLSD